MPAMNIEIRQMVADLIGAGLNDRDIKKSCNHYQYVHSIREILDLGLPLDTRIRKDGSINADPRPKKRTPEEWREWRREWYRKRREKQAFEFTEESDGALNITLVASEQKQKARKDKPSSEKRLDLSQSVLSQAKEFSYTWESLLGKDNWSVSKGNSESVLSGLKELRTLTSRMIKKVEELSNE